MTNITRHAATRPHSSSFSCDLAILSACYLFPISPFSTGTLSCRRPIPRSLVTILPNSFSLAKSVGAEQISGPLAPLSTRPLVPQNNMAHGSRSVEYPFQSLPAAPPVPLTKQARFIDHDAVLEGMVGDYSRRCPAWWSD